jgi:hypothetical protein
MSTIKIQAKHLKMTLQVLTKFQRMELQELIQENPNGPWEINLNMDYARIHDPKAHYGN